MAIQEATSEENIQTPSTVLEVMDGHSEPLQTEAPVELLESLKGVAKGTAKAITAERHKRAIEDAKALSEALERNEALENAKIDTTTGVRSREAWNNEYTSLINRFGGGEIAAHFVDLNGLNRANNQMGHNGGDKYLKAMAKSVLGSVRPTDLVYRVGGDEFVILMEGEETEEDMSKAAKRIRDNTEKAVNELGFPKDMYLGVSMGSALKEEGETPDELIARADMVLLADKEAFYSEIQARTGKDLRR